MNELERKLEQLINEMRTLKSELREGDRPGPAREVTPPGP
jgi:hypothetical protein